MKVKVVKIEHIKVWIAVWCIYLPSWWIVEHTLVSIAIYMSYLKIFCKMKLVHLLLLIDWYFLLTLFYAGGGTYMPPLPDIDNFLPTYWGGSQYTQNLSLVIFLCKLLIRNQNTHHWVALITRLSLLRIKISQEK